MTKHIIGFSTNCKYSQVETLLSGINYQVFTSSADHSDLIKVLTETSRISLKPGFGFEAISTRFKSAISQALAAKHVNVRISDYELFWLPPVDVDLGFVTPMLAGLSRSEAGLLIQRVASSTVAVSPFSTYAKAFILFVSTL